MNRQRLSTTIVMLAALTVQFSGIGQGEAVAGPRDTGIADYFNTPNWANSPPLRKFVDGLPGLNAGNANNLGQYIPVAVADTTTYPGSDYYEIEVGQYREQMHSDLPPVSSGGGSGGTLLRGYRQTNGPSGNSQPFHYLGPLIDSAKNRAVRIKFTNALPIGVDGDLFIPVDTSIMGAGDFEINYDPETKLLQASTTGVFTQNRADLHLHGGRTPWISDGTAHQWITPAGESTAYPKGVSVAYVPDMWFDAAGATIASCAGKTICTVAGATNNPGAGSQTYYWTNQQSSRMMFFHDHSWGITRLGVYAGGAAGLLVRDPTENKLIANGLIPGRIAGEEIPLILQDKTYVDGVPASPTYVLNTDPTWIWGSQPGTIQPWSATGALPVTGDLWWPHVYMSAQNPFNPDLSGINAYGRWHYGPWFWPPTKDVLYGPVLNEYYDPNCVPDATNNYFCQPPERPGTPNPSWGAEAFMDTPVINGTAYPVLTVDPKKYRFRILNAAHDRFWNLQMYVADPSQVFEGRLTEVKMVPAITTPGFPANWPVDNREGGAPDPATRGPAMIQIGTEGGFLPAPVVLPNQPVNWNVDPTTFTAGLVLQQNQGGGTLMLGPAERADVIVDFSQFAGKTLILYNDAPAPWPALDPHYDYFTGAPDNRSMGGADTTPVGYGPNTRTIMQIKVSGSGGSAPPDDYNATTLTNLKNAFKSTSTTKGVFASGQEPIIVGQTAYNSAYNKTFPVTYPNWGVSRITDTSLSFMKVDGSIVSKYPIKPKAIQDEMGEVFDDYGRMSAKLGLELPFTHAGIQTFVLQNFVDPPTEVVGKDQVQIWKITHNGVDTHPVHFHMFEVQLLNRVGWDGFIYLPDPNELGWKDTVRVSPLEDTIVALRPAQFNFPFTVPESIRPLNPAYPLGSTVGFSNLDPLTAQPIVTVNEMYNFGHEYLWHCHILSHEESDMMRPIVLNPNTKVDILWRNSRDGKNLAWFMDGITTVSQALLPVETDQNWKVVGRGDFNGDSKPDILWRNTLTGANKVWYMDGNIRLGQVPILPIVADQKWKIVGTGDFNGDGKSDILWRNSTTGQNKVWYMNKIIYSGSGSIATVPGSAWIIAGTGDFNGDGKSDILWKNTSTGAVLVWYMNGVTFVGSGTTTSETDKNWKIVGVGDFNNDVKPDILWRNSVSGANRVWYMDGMVKLGEAPLLPTITDLNWTIVN
ncbi:MAG: FG-GAP-like repeat-containing protein [Desulfocapsaceae bacterium]|nr:FG-GAP-like repeat-containing protein [Desulfocapsaceae bacterium]